jgi:hypothetical protein
MTLLVRNGSLRQGYYKEEHVSRVLPDFWMAPHLSDKLASLSIQSSPVRRLLFEKIVLESGETGREKRPDFTTSALPPLFLTLAERESGSLAHIKWQNAEAFVLIPGSKLAGRPALFLSGDSAEEDASAMGLIESWKETDCALTIYRGGMESEAWLEAHLNVLFESMCNYLLVEYGYLTGRVMITVLIQNLMILSSQNGWEVARRGNGIIDQTVFAAPQEAALAYRKLLGMALEHMSAVVGSVLAQSVKRHGMDVYNSFYLSLIKTYELI